MRRTAPHKAASTLAPARKVTAAVTVAIASASLSEIGSGTGAPRGRVLEPIGPSPRPAFAKSHRADSPRSSRHAECRADHAARQNCRPHEDKPPIGTTPAFAFRVAPAVP